VLRKKEWDVTPLGLVDPNSLEEPPAPLFRVQEFFPSKSDDGNARSHQDVSTYVSNTTASHTMNP